MTRHNIPLSTLKDCFRFLLGLRKDKKVEDVASELHGRIKTFYSDHTGMENTLRSALSDLLTRVDKFYSKLVVDKLAQQAYTLGQNDAAKLLDALLECMPKFLAAMYFLWYNVDEGFRTVGGGGWRQNHPGVDGYRWVLAWAKYGDWGGDLQKYLRAFNDDHYRGIIPGGFNQGDVKDSIWDGYYYGYYRGEDMVVDIKAILNKQNHNFFRDVFVTSVISTETGIETSNTANVVGLLGVFCEIVARDENEAVQSALQEDLKRLIPQKCLDWERLKGHCNMLKRTQIDTLFKKATFDHTGQSPEIKNVNHVEFVKEMTKWLRKHLLNVREKVSELNRIEYNSTMVPLNHFATKYVFPYGFVFGDTSYGTLGDAWSSLKSIWKKIVCELSRNDNSGPLHRLKRFLDGEHCPKQENVKDEEADNDRVGTTTASTGTNSGTHGSGNNVVGRVGEKVEQATYWWWNEGSDTKGKWAKLRADEERVNNTYKDEQRKFQEAITQYDHQWQQIVPSLEGNGTIPPDPITPFEILDGYDVQDHFEKFRQQQQADEEWDLEQTFYEQKLRNASLTGYYTAESKAMPNFSGSQGPAAIGVPMGYPIKPPKLPKTPPPPLPTMELNGNPIPDYDSKYSWLPPPGIHIESAPRTVPTTDVDIEKPYTAEEIMKTELRRTTYLPQEMIDPEPLPAYNVGLDIAPKLKVYNNSSYMPTAELKPQPVSNPEFSIHIPKPTLQDSSYDVNIDDPPLPNLQPLDPIDAVTAAINLDVGPIDPPDSLPNRYVDPYTHDAQAVGMCTAPWMNQAETGESTDIPETELFPSEAPRTVRDMLTWLAGLKNEKHHGTLRQCINKAFSGLHKDTSQLALSINGHNIRPKDVFDILQLTAMFASSVLTSITPNWRASVASRTVKPQSSDESDEPDCCALLCQLRDYVYACCHQLEFLKSQCKRDKQSGGWKNCSYGSDTKTPSPLQAFLTDDWDSDFKTHFFDPRNLCHKSRVRMGFKREDLSNDSQTGSTISAILIPICGGSNPLLTLCSYLNCLTKRTPRTTGELVSFFHHFGMELHDYDQTMLSSLGSSLSTPHHDCPDWDHLGRHDLVAVKGIVGHESLFTIQESKHDHPRTLSTLVGCSSDPATCPPHCSPITYRAYALYSHAFTHAYLSWAAYLPDRLHESLEKLHYDFQKHKCSDGKSLHSCSTALPLLYSHGFTPPEGTSQSPLTCQQIIFKLKEMANGKPIESLMTAMDNFLYRVREPFILTLVALWFVALLLFANTMLYRLDVLRIRSHLTRSRGSHVIDVKALLTDGTKMPSLYDIDYFDEDVLSQFVVQ